MEFQRAFILLAGAAMCLTNMTAACPTASAANSAVSLASEERIVFLGDSITQAGAQPGGYVSLVRDDINAGLGDLKIEVIGAGISGNKVPDLEKRLDRDVIAKKPTIVVIYIGINDVWHSQNGNGTPKDKFESGLKSLISRIGDSGARTILCTPSVIGEKADGSNPLDTMLDEYAEISRRVATETGTQLFDLRQACVTWLAACNTAGAENNVLTTDGVHLNPAGNRFVADQMLKALGVRSNPPRVLRHVVLFKYKDDATKTQVDHINREFGRLQSRIPQIAGFEWGTNNSPEGLADGLTHAFVVTFRSEADRDAYLPHAAHLSFVKLLKPQLDKAVVIDFWTNE